MIEPEPVKSLKKQKLDQIMSDEEYAAKLPTEYEEENRLVREKEEADVAMIEEWDDIQAKIKAYGELAARLQAEEQEEFTDAEKTRLFCEFFEQRRKFFAAKRAEEKRNKPPTQAQQKKPMSNYLKNMEGYTLKQLKGYSFKHIQQLFDRAMKRVNTFVDFRTELVEEGSKRAEVIEGSSKRAGDELEQEHAKKQKIEEYAEMAELKKLTEEVSDEEGVAIDVVPLATKNPIIDWKIHTEGEMRYYQIIRAGVNAVSARVTIVSTKVNVAEFMLLRKLPLSE
ncbi:hypothetical protein Tco_0809353 [Tanacetum coccineum]